MIIREQDRHFLLSIFGGTGLILFWRGVWELPMQIPHNDLPWISLFIGLTILTLTGLVYKEFDPLGGFEKTLQRKFKSIQLSPYKKEFSFIYEDPETNLNTAFSAEKLQSVESNYLVFEIDKTEIFIPFKTITEIRRNNEEYWKY